MSEHPLLTALAILEVVYVVSMAGWIVLQKRAPLATVAWILALALLPVLGFFVYLFLRPDELPKAASSAFVRNKLSRGSSATNMAPCCRSKYLEP